MHPMAVIQHKASIHDLMEETLLVDRLDPVIERLVICLVMDHGLVYHSCTPGKSLMSIEPQLSTHL